MVRAERFLPDGQRAFVEWLCLRETILRPVQFCMAVEAHCHEGMAGAEEFLPDGQRAFVERFRLGIFAVAPVEFREVIQACRSIGMVGAILLFRYSYRLLDSRHCPVIVAFLVK